MKSTAIILAAGQGKRMNSTVAKQYLLIEDKPVLYYTLQAFQNSEVDDIVVVVQEGDEQYVRETLIDSYHFTKVTKIVHGGKERYHSVYQALCNIERTDYVLIHDGARPLVSVTTINRTLSIVKESKACVVGMPSKDTIKIVDTNDIIVDTPKRDRVWLVQTPQAFEYKLIKEAYEKLLSLSQIEVTDDAMVVEQMLAYPIHMVEGSYENIKITTPEDITIACAILRSKVLK